MCFFFSPELKLKSFQVKLSSTQAAVLPFLSSSQSGPHHLMHLFNSKRKRHNCTFQQKSSSLYPSHLLHWLSKLPFPQLYLPRPAWLHFKPNLLYVLVKIKCFAIVFTIKSAWMAVGTIQESSNFCSRSGWGISSSFQLILVPTVIRCSFCRLLHPAF